MAFHDSKCSISMIIPRNMKLWTAFQECVILVTKCEWSRTRVINLAARFSINGSLFSFSSTKTTTYMVIRRFRSREICFTWRNWRLTCIPTQRVTTFCMLRVLLRDEYMTCMYWGLPLWQLGCILVLYLCFQHKLAFFQVSLAMHDSNSL